MKISFTLNDQPVTVNVDPATSLLETLRGVLGMTGTKQGCDFEGECGACTVLLNSTPVRSCLIPTAKVAGQKVLTIEGLADCADAIEWNGLRLHPLQVAFIETGAVQCGFCTPGMILSAQALLDRIPTPNQENIEEALDGNICRCGAYPRIVEAIVLAASWMHGDRPISLETNLLQVVGGDLTRLDVVDKVTGQTRFAEDIILPGLLQLKVFRSPHHHTRLLSLDIEKAMQSPGVVRVITEADIPGKNGLSDYSLGDESILVAVGDTAKHLGDAIALVVGVTPEHAQAGVDAIQAQFQLLPYTFDAEDALEEDAFPIHNENNLLHSYSITNGTLEKSLDSSDFILKSEYQTSFLEHAALERETVLGYIDEEDRVTVQSGTHEPHWHQRYIAPILDLPLDRVRVVVPPTGGSFGGKQDPWPLAATALATHLVRQPVRLAYTRRESFLVSPKRHPYQMRYLIGSTLGGKLTGFQARISANTGAYDAGGCYVTNYAAVASGGPYRWPAADTQAQSIYTNGPKAGQMRGFGMPQPIFALECSLDELAQVLNIDPLELRLKNAVTDETLTFLGCKAAESLGYVEVLEAIRPHYDALSTEVQAFNSHSEGSPWRKGLGLAGMWYRFGKAGKAQVEAHAELSRNGDFVVYCSAPDYGQGIATVMSQLAAETLGVARERITVVNADTAFTPDSDMPGASKMTYWLGNAVCEAAKNLGDEIRGTAAEILNCPPRDLKVIEDQVSHLTNRQRSVSLEAIAREWDSMGKPRKVIGMFDLSQRFPGNSDYEFSPHFVTGADLAEILLNTETGQVEVTRIVAVHDVGKAINPRDAKGQIEGAILMGLGAAIMEEYLPGRTVGFKDYYVPTVKSTPAIEVLLVEVPSYYGPFGAKGLGEAPVVPVAPAIVNAISRAAGTRIRSLPATAEQILEAMNGPERTRHK